MILSNKIKTGLATCGKYISYPYICLFITLSVFYTFSVIYNHDLNKDRVTFAV